MVYKPHSLNAAIKVLLRRGSVKVRVKIENRKSGRNMPENGCGMHILKKKCMEIREIGGVERERERRIEKEREGLRKRERD